MVIIYDIVHAYCNAESVVEKTLRNICRNTVNIALCIAMTSAYFHISTFERDIPSLGETELIIHIGQTAPRVQYAVVVAVFAIIRNRYIAVEIPERKYLFAVRELHLVFTCASVVDRLVGIYAGIVGRWGKGRLYIAQLPVGREYDIEAVLQCLPQLQRMDVCRFQVDVTNHIGIFAVFIDGRVEVCCIRTEDMCRIV